MNITKIKIMYSPVLQEMKFFREQKTANGTAAYSPITDSKPLEKYIHEKRGGLILQDMNPAEFFDDIAAVSNRAEKIIIDFAGTEDDCNDLKTMASYYNQKARTEIEVNHYGKLPDPGSLYDKIKAATLEVVKKFENERIPENSNIPESIDRIKQRIESLNNSDVNLCFVGSYSSGKSTIINAILGYAVLPEAVDSKTAKMFKISKPRIGEPVSVRFIIGSKGAGIPACIEWSETEDVFRFKEGPNANSIRDTVQEIINANKTKKQHVQLQEILSSLNSQIVDANASAYISRVIDVYFPIPLSKSLNFTIYDTPGTDSNFDDHYEVLKEALQNQNSSILIYVNDTRLEGTGNATLLRLLKDLNENSKASATVDIGRSLFVINKADAVTKVGDFDVLKNSVIKAKEGNKGDETPGTSDDFQIDLAEKRVLFVSAMTAYAAKASINDVSTGDDNAWYTDNEPKVQRGAYYKHNRMAKAEHLTDALIRNSQKELTSPEVRSDSAKQLVINSGLYALEREIIRYGDKFALAVKAKGLIDAVNELINTLRTEYGALESNLKVEEGELAKKIKKLEADVQEAVENAYKDFMTAEGHHEGSLQLKRSLFLDDETSLGLFRRIETVVDSEFGFIKNLFNSNKAAEIDKKIKAEYLRIMAEHKGKYINERHNLLNKRFTVFESGCDAAIVNVNNVSLENKDFILGIPRPAVPTPSSRINISNYTKSNRASRWADGASKKKYQDDVKNDLSKNISEFTQACLSDFSDAIGKMCDTARDGYIKNIGKLSGKMKQTVDNRQAVQAEMKWCGEMGIKVQSSAADLLGKIWGEANE